MSIFYIFKIFFYTFFVFLVFTPAIAQQTVDQDSTPPEETTMPPEGTQETRDTEDPKDTGDVPQNDPPTDTAEVPSETPAVNTTQQPPKPTTTAPNVITQPQNPTLAGTICPAAPVLASLLANHNITQDYVGNKMTSLVSGSINITIGSDVVKSVGTNTIKVAMSGSFPQAQCTMKGGRDLAVSLKGICEAGLLTLTLTEAYQAGSQTMTCPGTSKTYPIPANTVSHTVKLRVQNGSTYTAPFAGQSGSGNYSWSLKMKTE